MLVAGLAVIGGITLGHLIYHHVFVKDLQDKIDTFTAVLADHMKHHK